MQEIDGSAGLCAAVTKPGEVVIADVGSDQRRIGKITAGYQDVVGEHGKLPHADRRNMPH